MGGLCRTPLLFLGVFVWGCFVAFLLFGGFFRILLVLFWYWFDTVLLEWWGWRVLRVPFGVWRSLRGRLASMIGGSFWFFSWNELRIV